MNCRKCNEVSGDYALGKLGEADTADVRSHLEACPDCRRELDSLSRTVAALDSVRPAAPSNRMRARLLGAIESEKLSQGPEPARGAARPAPLGRPRPRVLPALAGLAGAGLLLAAGFVLGERSATQHQLADLRSRMDTVGQLLEQSVLQKRPTGDRLETVLRVGAIDRPDNRVIDGLINSMAFDPSVNVRLNALNALYSHSGQQVVRSGVLACLPREPNPLVQISMIDFLVAARAREASAALARLAGDERADADVRDSARRAIELL